LALAQVAANHSSAAQNAMFAQLFSLPTPLGTEIEFSVAANSRRTSQSAALWAHYWLPVKYNLN
jgi:hypothetical protein